MEILKAILLLHDLRLLPRPLRCLMPPYLPHILLYQSFQLGLLCRPLLFRLLHQPSHPVTLLMETRMHLALFLYFLCFAHLHVLRVGVPASFLSRLLKFVELIVVNGEREGA